MTSDCEHPDEAFKAVSVMVGEEAETYWATRAALPGADLDPELLVRGQQDRRRQAGDGLLAGELHPVHHVPTWQQVVTTFAKQAVLTYNGQGSVEDL